MSLSPEQRAVVESWGRGLAVVAGAGCGKTTTLVAKCRALLERQPDARITAVSFTEKSANDLRLKLSEHLDLRQHRVTTIHGLCTAILREFPDAAGIDGDERVLSAPEARAMWEEAFDAFWSESLPTDLAPVFERLCEEEGREPLFRLLSRVHDLAGFGATDALETSESQRERGLAMLTRWIGARYEKLKASAGALDFHDLEARADYALTDPEVARLLASRIDLILVDEFQDTNPVQARIVERLTRRGPDGAPFGNLVVVGDPKQSIYRFRDADVTVFEEFCAKLPERHVLSWNFRSRPGIIQWVNEVCAPVFAAGAMHYDALEARREPVGTEPVIALRPAEDALAPAELARWLLDHPFAGTTALILRKIRGNERWIQALRHAGVRVAVASGGFFWDDPRVREMVAFLRWRAFGGNAQQLVTLLRAPWMGVDDSRIDAWTADERGVSAAFLESDHPLAEKLREKGVAPLAAAEELELLLWSDENERELGSAWLGLWHRAQDLAAQGVDAAETAKRFARAVEDRTRETEVPPPTGPGQLTVLTVHGAKGLEFDRVVLVEFRGKERAPNAPMLFWDRHRGVFLGVRDAEGARDKETESEWRELETAQQTAENQRIFYVALTRAKEQLVLVITGDVEKALAKPKADWLSWVAPTLGSLPDRDSANAASAAAAAAPAPVADYVPLPRLAPRTFRARHSVSEWVRLAHCPRQYAWGLFPARIPGGQAIAFAPPVLSDGEPVRRGADWLPQAELGTRVHELLERQDWEGLRQLGQRVGRDRLNAEGVIEWGQAARERARGEARVELSFEAAIGGEVLAGTIDRLEQGEEGFRLLDYKVLSRDTDEGEIRYRYEAQLWMYAWAVGRLDPLVIQRLAVALVLFSPTAARELTVKIPSPPELEAWLGDLAQRSAAIIAGQAAVPTPHPVACARCEFKAVCDASFQSATRS